MKIGVDLDGVLAFTAQYFLEYHNKKYGTKNSVNQMTSYYFKDLLGGTWEDELQKFKEFGGSKIFKTMPPLQGAKEGIEDLGKDNDLHIITARNSFNHQRTHEWLQTHFPNKFSKVHFSNMPDLKRKKHEICLENGIEVHIEDKLDTVLECADAGIRVLLMNHPWNQAEDLPENVTRVNSWQEIVSLLKI